MAFERGRAECRAASRRYADEEDGHRGDISSPEHLQTSAWSQNLSLSVAKLAVTRPNQVWAMDLTYVPMARGFVYLCAVVD
jgi:transposase InsO family protein